MKLTKIGEFLIRSKIPIDIQDNLQYNRVTIRINHNGVSLRDSEIGSKIGTKKQFILKSGQFIVSKIDARYGAFGIAPREVEGAIITGNFWAYDVDKKKVNIEWFNQFTNSSAFYEICERASSGITHRKYLDEKFFLNYEIFLPSVDEQLIQIEKINRQKISFGNLSTELTHQLALVKKLRQQLLQDAVQGKLVKQDKNDEPASELLKKIKSALRQAQGTKKIKELPPIKPEEIPFDIPKNWVWCRLGEICTKIHYGFNASAKPEKKEVRLLRITDIQDNKVDWESVPGCDYSDTDLKNYSLNINDIMIARTGGTIGKTFLVKDISVKSLFASYLIRAVPSKYLVAEYLKLYLESPIYWKQLYDAAWGAGQPNVNATSLSNLKVPLPPLAEQSRIVQKLEELMQYCNELEASIKESEIQNSSLLQQVLREALRPAQKNANKKSAAV
jgi:type I restriction enzyme S subunit